MDLLKTFVYDGGAGGVGHSLKEEILVEENVELSLGLSMNGRFGVERRCTVVDNNYSNNDRLSRSSSVTDFSSFPSTNDDPTPLSLYSPLTRTCSLPIETEEWKKRKELQSLRRSEAKRKRVEKLKNGRVVKGSTAEEIYETKRRNLTNGNELWRSSLPSLLPPLPRPPPVPSQVSIGSPASGGSSGVSDLECQHFSGTNKEVESKSTTSNQSISHKISSSSLNRSNLVASEHVAGKLSATSSQILSGNRSSKDETLKVMLADMPCVSTKGDGINGKKIEGFLYRYRKGEEVRIVCVCHGSFLTPAEFVKHGGGGDVEHPLRHIVVNPPSL
ncbi:ninja-family protein AFP3-like [Cynara cardunculus var. scolymus]|uniref:ninja-family protein AFP3-like n=1 Tax=Cynara cardunculus var. scolymus TaxID=59895 RepID=UPI000D62F652|nr:ninja-family protein AFP3-like [Cynara cardunculus var. scolymus]